MPILNSGNNMTGMNTMWHKNSYMNSYMNSEVSNCSWPYEFNMNSWYFALIRMVIYKIPLIHMVKNSWWPMNSYVNSWIFLNSYMNSMIFMNTYMNACIHSSTSEFRSIWNYYEFMKLMNSWTLNSYVFWIHQLRSVN